jgi:hypothetical protein
LSKIRNFRKFKDNCLSIIIIFNFLW